MASLQITSGRLPVSASLQISRVLSVLDSRVSRYGSGTSAHWRVPPLPHFTPNLQFTTVATTIAQNDSEEDRYFDFENNHTSYRILSSLNRRHRRFSSGNLCRWTESPLTAHHLCARWLHTSMGCCEEDKSMVEKAVDSMKQKKQAKTLAGIMQVQPEEKPDQVVEAKPPLLTRFKDALMHYYHGFRLLFLELKITARLLGKAMKGKSLSRREKKQFRRTAGDLFRMVPFSAFVIIPFMEFLLPVYLFVFPSALPSTFQSEKARETRKAKELKVKLQMAKFLQETLEEMAVAGKSRKKKNEVQQFSNFFNKIRTTGEQASTEEILKFSKLFENELTLDNLSRPQLVALCRLLLLQPIGSSNFLRFQLRMKLRQLEADDKMIMKEGVESLTVRELQAASQARGMRAIGMQESRLKSQLQQWLDLHLNKQIPMSLLLLSRALYLPDEIPTANVLQATLSTLPETIVEEAEVLVASTAGESVDNRTRVDVVQQQEILIREEEREKMEREREKLGKEMEKEGSIAAAFAGRKVPELVSPVVEKATVTDSSQESFSAEELRDLSQVVSSLKPSLEEERETLEEIREDREEYCEDVADLAEQCEGAGDEEALEESSVSRHLGKRVEAMLSSIDSTLSKLEGSSVHSKLATTTTSSTGGDSITVQQLEEALLALRGTSGEAKFRSLFSVLDEDHDGNIAIDEMAEVIEALAMEDTDISPDHIKQIKHLVLHELRDREKEKENLVSTDHL